MKDYNKEPNYIHSCDSKMLDEVYRDVFRIGYKQAIKDVIALIDSNLLPAYGGKIIRLIEQEYE